jgi:hypothetical protein
MEDSVDPNSEVLGGAVPPGSGLSGGSGTNSFLTSLFSAGGNVLTQQLKNQALGTTAAQQAKLAQAQAANSSSTIKIIIIAVIGLAVVGLTFAFLKRKKG